MPKILRKIKDDAITIAFDGDVAGEGADQLFQLALKALLEESSLVIFDLSRVEFMDSRGIGVLSNLNKRMTDQGRNTAIIGLSGIVKRAFERTRMDKVLPIFGSEEEARKLSRQLTIKVDRSNPEMILVVLDGALKPETAAELMEVLEKETKSGIKDFTFDVNRLEHVDPETVYDFISWMENIIKHDRRVQVHGDPIHTEVFANNPVIGDLIDIIHSPVSSTPILDRATVQVRQEQEFQIIRVRGVLWSRGADEFSQALQEAIEQKPLGVILELSECSEIDSSGLGVIVNAIKQMKEFGAQMAMIDPSPRVLRIIKIAGLDKIIRQFNSEAEAAAELRKLGPLGH